MSKKTSGGKQFDRPLQIGTVPFCNAWPLTKFLPEMLPGCNIVPLLPSQMQFRLITHHLDMVMMPIVELMSMPNGLILGNTCIACLGAVESVLLMSKKPIKKIETVSLDVASRCSVTLADVLFRAFCKTKPEKYKLETDADLENVPSDAFVVIGDRALSFEPSEKWEYRYDLGELWYDATGLPFVFAAWIASAGPDWKANGVIEAVQKARDKGVASIDTILKENTDRLPVDSLHMMYDYFTIAIHYTLGEDEIVSMNTFLDLAHKYEIIPQRRPLIVDWT